MDLDEIVLKLVGPIDPVGETNEDGRRLKNIEALTDLVNQLVRRIREVAPDADRQEASMRVIGKHARKFLDDLGYRLSEQ